MFGMGAMLELLPPLNDHNIPMDAIPSDRFALSDRHGVDYFCI